jgi:hypothetical protein
MTVRCLQCGQENNPQYRFCGICGAPLGPPAQVAVPTDQGRERVRVPVSGPSFLGLGDERSRDLDYLLEDEPPRGRGRLYLALLLLIVSGALLAWQWQREGYPWSGYIPKPTASTSVPTSTPANPAPDSAAAAAPVVPVQPTANPAPPEAQAATSEAGPPPAAEPAGSTPANTSAAAKSVEPTSVPPTSPPPTSPPSDAPDSGEAAARAPAAAPSQANEPEAAEPTPKETAPVVPAPKTARSKPSPALTSQPDSFEDRLVADGEKYLYGRGVPEDCARAQRNLQIGARESNARAQTLLGAMYATGHCVNRDLPTAYRWFAKALHGDPGNSRVQRDLEVLWNQMTPEERQLAMKSQ